MISHNIQQRINAITTTSFNLWQHETKDIMQGVPYFEDVLPALGKSNGQYDNQPLLDWLLVALEQKENEGLRRRSASVLGEMGKVAAQHPGVLEALLAALEQKEDWVLRQSAASALGEMGESVATEEVVAVLTESVRAGGDVALQSAHALGELGERAGKSDKALDALVGMVRISGTETWTAAESLRKLGTKAAIPNVLAALVEILYPGGERAWAAAYVLGELGQKAATEEVLAALVEMLRAGGRNAWIAAYVLGKMGPDAETDATFSALMELVHTGEYDAWATAYALGFGEKAELRDDLIPEVLTGLVERVLSGEWGTQYAVHAIAKLGDRVPIPEEVLNTLVRMLHYGGDDLQAGGAEAWDAMKCLECLGSNAATPRVLASLLAVVRAGKEGVDMAARVLCKIGDDAVTDEVVSILERRVWVGDSRAAESLGVIGEKAATPGVLGALANMVQAGKWGAIYAAIALGQMGKKAATSEVLGALREMALGSEHAWHAVGAFGSIGESAATASDFAALVEIVRTGGDVLAAESLRKMGIESKVRFFSLKADSWIHYPTHIPVDV